MRKAGLSFITGANLLLVLGIVAAIFMIVAVSNAYTNAAYGSCWAGVKAQVSKLCLAGGIGCDTGTSTKNVQVDLPNCIEAVVFTNANSLQTAMGTTDTSGMQCPAGSKGYFIMVPRHPSWWNYFTDLIKTWQERSTNIECNPISKTMNGRDFIKLSGPASGSAVRNYCVSVSYIADNIAISADERKC